MLTRMTYSKEEGKLVSQQRTARIAYAERGPARRAVRPREHIVDGGDGATYSEEGEARHTHDVALGLWWASNMEEGTQAFSRRPNIDSAS